MADIETVTLTVHSARAVILTLGGGLGVSVAFAATVPMHDPIAATVARVCTQAFWVLSVALRALVVAWVWAVRYARRYTYRGNSRPVRRGQHRPQVVNRWQAGRAYNARLPLSALRSQVVGA